MCQIWRLLLWKSPKACQNVTIEFCFIMRIFYELRYTVIIDTVWIFWLKSVPAKFQKYSNHISWVISGTSSSKLSCNPRHPSRNISCNHRHHLLQPSSRRIFSTLNNQKTRVDSDINSDYKACSFDKLYIRRRKWDTAGFVRARQRKYWNALTVGRGHADDGCSCNHRAVPPSDVPPFTLRKQSCCEHYWSPGCCCTQFFIQLNHRALRDTAVSCLVLLTHWVIDWLRNQRAVPLPWMRWVNARNM